MPTFDAKYWFSIAPGWAEYVAMDEDGEVWAYEMRPFRVGTVWLSNKGDGESLGFARSWGDSLTSRSELTKGYIQCNY